MQGRREVPAAELGAPLVHDAGGPLRGRRRGQWGQRVAARPVPPDAALRVSPRILNFKVSRLVLQKVQSQQKPCLVNYRESYGGRRPPVQSG